MRIRSTVRILLVEDEPEVRGYLEVALQTLGFSVDALEESEEALARLRENGAEYSLFLLGFGAPGKGGLEIMREVRQFDTGLPIIALSSGGSPAQVEAAVRSGASDFLAKPVGHEELNRAIHKALRMRPEETADLAVAPEPAADPA